VLVVGPERTLAYSLRAGEPIGRAEGLNAGWGDGWVATVTGHYGKTTLTVHRL
jgi:hypothetical protein